MHSYANKASASQLMMGLRSLGLVVDGVAQDHLGELAGSDSDLRRGLIESLLRDAYGSDFISALDNMSLEEVEVELRQLGTTDSTHKRALPFFINAAKAAGLAMQPEVSKRARKRAPRKARVVQPQMDAVLPGPPIPIQPEPVASPSGPLYAASFGMLSLLPESGQWTVIQADRWMHAMTAVIALETTIVDSS